MAAAATIAGYELVPDWEQLPPGWVHRDVAGVAVNADDEVHLLTRLDARVIVYGRDGAFLRAWGEDIFSQRPHGIAIAADGSVWVTDEGAQVLRRFTPEGDLVQTVGTPGEAAATGADSRLGSIRARVDSVHRSGPPFNRPTNVAVAPSGDLYVADGYGNARVHQFTADGELVRSWGAPGGEPGEFRLPHDICVTPAERVLVADRENNRVQVFDGTGRFLEEWTGLQRPAGLALHPSGGVVVTEMSWQPGYQPYTGNAVEEVCPGRVSLFDERGKLVDRWPGGQPECAPCNFTEPHSVAVDSSCTVYVAEVTHSGTAGRDLPPDCHTFQTFKPAAGATGTA